MKNLYRRYRPLRLGDVVGQDQVVKPLEASLQQGKIGHAYLFIGPRGCGKTSVARILAHEVNGFEYQLEDDYVDIIEIDGASNRGIDNIRELREKAAIAPSRGKYKVYIIDEVHMLTKEAFNALLKTLEEPPSHVIFIMATTDAYKVPVTITSRAQTYTFRLADVQVMLRHLKAIADKEKINITDEALEIIAKRGGGSFRDSLSLLDQISTLSDTQITKGLVVEVMGLPDDEKIDRLLGAYAASDIVATNNLIKELYSAGIKPETIAEELISRIVAEPKPELLPLLGKLPEVKAPFAEARLLVSLFTGGTPAATVPSTSSAQAEHPSQATTYSTPPKTEQRVESKTLQASPKVVSSQPVVVETSAKSTGPFDWQTFVQKVKEQNEALFLQLNRARHEIIQNELHIYPQHKTARNVMMRDKNIQFMHDAAGGVKITIHELGDTPVNKKEDEMISKLSDIMGGEVVNDGGENPF